MNQNTEANDGDIAAIRRLMSQELSLSFSRDKDADWESFSATFVPDAAMFPGARPVKPQSLGQFIERMKRMRSEGKLFSFVVTPLGCDVRVFGNVAIAFAACSMIENESEENREMNATLLVREDGAWRIAAQAWDVESANCKIPLDLLQAKPS